MCAPLYRIVPVSWCNWGLCVCFQFPEIPWIPGICFFCQLSTSKSRRRRAAVRTSASYSVSLLTVNLARLVNH